MAKTNDIRLGQLLVQKRVCTLRQVNEALLSQKDYRARNEHVPLGKILRDKGVIDVDTLCQTLAELGALRLHCPSCRADYAVNAYQPKGTQSCPRCKAAMVFNDEPPARGNALLKMDEEVEAAPPHEEAPPQADAAKSPPHAAPKPDDATQRDSHIGKVLGGCQILEKIAHGGMGVVYKARQLNLGRTVAVKILSRDLANDATFVRRFIQEARSAAQLSHGNIVHINDVGECQGVFYFVMEYVDGKNLKEILKADEKLDYHKALEIMLQVCQALRHAHNRGIIHRDIKPENIMITREGVVKLADLGLAKKIASEHTSGITHAGSILGTPFYMAPEQAKDFSKVDRRSDIYSLGVTLYRMLTGRVPFDGRSPIEVMIKAIDGKKAPICELCPDVPQDVEQIVDRMMHKQPEKRYQEVDELIRDLMKVTNKVPAS